MTLKCYRCDGELDDTTPSDVEDIKFYSCQSCYCEYKMNVEGRLCDRWMMPITLPLYGVIFGRDPLKRVKHIVDDMASKDNELKKIMIEHISDELEVPKQRITDIHKFEYPNEDNLREFLRLFKEGLQESE